LEQPELPVAEGALAEVVPPPVSTSAPPSAPPVSTSAPPAPTSPPPVPAGQRRPWYRHWSTWVAAGLVLLLVGVTSVALLLREPYHEVTFASLSEWSRVPTDAKSVSYAFTAVNGDQAFLAFQQDDGLHIIGYDLAGRAKKWEATVKASSGSSSISWKGLIALPDMVLAEVRQYGGKQVVNSVFAVDWSGTQRWQHDSTSDDDYLVTPSAVVFTDKAHQRLVGLDPHSGNENWSVPDIKDQNGSSTNVIVPVYSADEMDGPAGVGGHPAGPVGDGRIVELSSDSSARVIDTASGRITKTKGNIGDPRQAVTLAYAGRLYVAGNDDRYQLLSYDVNSLTEGKLVYAAPDAKHRLVEMAPCGTAVCLLDVTASDSKTAQVLAVDPDSASVKWHRPAPGADVLAPLGAGLMAQDTTSSDRYTTVFGGDGAVLLGDQGKDQTGARVTGGSVLLFSTTLTTYPGDESLYGFSVGSHTRTPLGDVKKVRSANCSWNAKLLVCPSDRDFGVWRFAA
jgi:hypothetical protein